MRIVGKNQVVVIRILSKALLQMYDIDIEADAYMEEEGITTLRKWLYERKIAHVATPQAGKYNSIFRSTVKHELHLLANTC